MKIRKGIALFILIHLGIILPAKMLCAQNTPTTANKVPNKSGSVTVYKPSAYASGIPVNYVRVWEPQQPYSIARDVSSHTKTVSQVNHSTQYLDGLGRSLQTVNWQMSPSGQDVVSPFVYDQYGREQYKFLPYTATTNDGVFKIDPFGEQSTFY